MNLMNENANFLGHSVSTAPVCTYGAPGDPCLAAWYEGTGPYATGPLDAIMFKSNNSAYGERDIFMLVSLAKNFPKFSELT